NKWQLAGVLAYALRNAVDALERRGVQEIAVSTAVTTDVRGWAALRVTAHGPEHSEFANVTTQTVARPQPAQSTTVSRNLAEQVVASHGGELVVVDLPAGRTIELYLPPMHVLGPESSSDDPGEPQERRGSVLVVDNEPMIRRALEITLRPEHDVTSVSSAQSALELLARGDPFDVILYDLSLPDLSGVDFHARLRALRPQVAQRIVFMRGVSSERDVALSELDVRQLEKPFTTEQLLARIAECMEARAASGAVAD
ncbi:MAG TPA: response regulator, partial [Polyangiales bacterium]|nr:response regulator [Polyangiales bacterium]